MMNSLASKIVKYKNQLQPNVWWKLKVNTHYKYVKILKIENIKDSTFVYFKDSMMNSDYRLEFFLDHHVPIQSKWELFYAKLNHLTSGFFY